MIFGHCMLCLWHNCLETGNFSFFHIGTGILDYFNAGNWDPKPPLSGPSLNTVGLRFFDVHDWRWLGFRVSCFGGGWLLRGSIFSVLWNLEFCGFLLWGVGDRVLLAQGFGAVSGRGSVGSMVERWRRFVGLMHNILECTKNLASFYIWRSSKPPPTGQPQTTDQRA